MPRFLLPLLIFWWGLLPVAANQATIDVLLVFEQNALNLLRAHSKTARQAAEMAINQLNGVLAQNEISDKVHFNCCGILNAPSYVSQSGMAGRSTGKDVIALRLGHVPGLEEAREESKADLVVMFTSYPVPRSRGVSFVSGGAAPVELDCLYFKQDRDDENSPVPLGFAASFHVSTILNNDSTFSHEVCHLLGAGHSDRQVSQCGPQSELDAAGTYVEGKCTLMCYSSYVDTEGASYHDWKNVEQRTELSDPTRSFPGGSTPLGDVLLHNNAAVMVRHASAVSVYGRDGSEKCINDNFADAIELPPLVPYEKKYYYFCRSLFYDKYEPIAEQLAENANLPLPAVINSMWDERQELIPVVAREFLAEKFAPEFSLEKNQNKCISCVYGTCTGASQEGGEPSLPGGIGSTVWYKVQAPGTGVIQAGIRKAFASPGFEPVLGIFVGDQVANLTPLEAHDVQDDSSQYFIRNVEAAVNEGDTVYIAVDESTSTSNRFVLVAKFSEGGSGRQVGPGTGGGTGGAGSGGGEEPGGGASSGGATGETPPPAAATPPAAWTETDTVLLVMCVVFLGVNLVLVYMLVGREQKPHTHNRKKRWWDWPTPRKNTPGASRGNRSSPCLVLDGSLSDGAHVSYTVRLADIQARSQYYVGRSHASDLCIDDGSLSRCHAAFCLKRDEKGLALWVADAGSTNGSRLASVRLTPWKFVKVHNHDVLQLGKCRFTLTVK